MAIPSCEGASDGDVCLWDAPSGKGGITFLEYSTCARRDLLLPGFELLPDWVLVGAHLSLLPQVCCLGSA
jgi:hypothetical protein